MDLKGKKIAFLGDSITEGAGASDKINGYVDRVKELANLKEAKNYGISGTRFAKQTKLFEGQTIDENYIKRVEIMDSDVDAVVVFGGTNDFGHGDAPYGNILDISGETFCGACDELMRKLIEKYNNIPIVFLTPLHRFTEDDLINEIGLPRKTLKEYVDAIRIKAEKYSIPILDLYSKSGMQPNVLVQNDLYFADGLHPNDKGHERIAKLLIKFFDGIVE